MRMLMLYILFKDGILEEDLQLLLQHAQLNGRSYELPLRNLDLLGPYRVTKSFAEHKTASKSRKRPKSTNNEEESYELSRFVPPIKTVLEELVNGTLDPETWAYTIDQPREQQPVGQQGSLRRFASCRLGALIVVNDLSGLREGGQALRKHDSGLSCSLRGEQHTLNHDHATKSQKSGIGMSF
jgi:hypothetical protein